MKLTLYLNIGINKVPKLQVFFKVKLFHFPLWRKNDSLILKQKSIHKAVFPTHDHKLLSLPRKLTMAGDLGQVEAQILLT
jgi:hypothetical protein